MCATSAYTRKLYYHSRWLDREWFSCAWLPEDGTCEVEVTEEDNIDEVKDDYDAGTADGKGNVGETCDYAGGSR